MKELLLNRFLNALYLLPDYVKQQLEGKWAIPLIAIGVVYLFAVLFNNKVARFLRNVFIFGLALFGVASYFLKRDIWCCAAILALIALIILRLLIYSFVTIRQNRINSRIEAKALAKAKKRRGTWQNRRGYSGKAKPLFHPEDHYDDDVYEEIAKAQTEEINKEEETTPEPQPQPEAKPQFTEAADAGSRASVMRYIDMLTELRDAGILTDQEFREKQSELFARLG